MRCPKCGCQDDKVVDSRSSREGSTIRRRRECNKCSHRFTTYEEIERAGLMVIKRDGRREEFSRDKLIAGINASFSKRPVSTGEIEEMVSRVVEAIANKFDSEVPTNEIGLEVMSNIRDLDKVAYVRYASIYRRFEEAEDFLDTVKRLEVKRDTATFPLPGF
ncbi:MAG: transcriptional regulator NrdR [Verrucomicrobiales bacterium]|nr:transcriptional regulator NrdR [Verrucomicrobiales bacterium]